MLYNIQIFKMAAIATTVLQETKPGDWAACAITKIIHKSLLNFLRKQETWILLTMTVNYPFTEMQLRVKFIV